MIAVEIIDLMHDGRLYLRRFRALHNKLRSKNLLAPEYESRLRDAEENFVRALSHIELLEREAMHWVTEKE